MMMRLLPLPLLLVLTTVNAQAAMHWESVPHKVTMAHIRSAPQMFRLEDGTGASARLMQPDLAVHPLPLAGDGRVTIKPDGKEYFHVLIAERDTPSGHESAIRYFHLFGRPTGVSPERVTDARKTALEIVPDPLPREHWSYLSNHSFEFVLRFNGKPLADHPVTLTTSNGTELTLKSDANGRVRLTFPDDFPEVHPGFMHNKPAGFTLRLAHVSQGKRYLTTLAGDYRTDPAHWQSFYGGVLVAGGGVLLGGFLGWRLRRRGASGKGRMK
ncbi:MAG: hypothetical protein D6678_05490 [Zetaproteobacteria bacterium]|nr:MAG: hypothetical protein D6678_05490 [Zetaproteobacteria bacterium]